MKSKSKGKDFCIFALPGLFCFFAVVIVPFIYGVYLTMTDWNGVSDVKIFYTEPDRGHRSRVYLAVCIFKSICGDR